jgi:UDP-glucose 4-epimerase
VNILVTGGAGYVGSATARRLIASGHEVVVLDDLSQGHRGAVPGDVLVVGRVDDAELVRRLVRERGCEAVLHFAASTYVGESVENPRLYYTNNVAGTLALLGALVDSGVSRIVFSSTCAIYGETAEMPLSEASPAAPESPYAFTKYAIERMIGDFSRAYGLRYALLRYFNAAGASADGRHGEDHDPETHLIPIVLQTLLGQRDQVRVFGDDYPTSDGTCVRDYVHVDDLAVAHERALAWSADRPPGGSVFNLGTGHGHSVLDVIRAVEAVTGRKVPWEMAERRPGDTARLVAAADRAHAELSWSPRYTCLEETVETAWRWHESQPDGYGDR